MIQINENIYLKKLKKITPEYLEFINDPDTCRYLHAGRLKHSKKDLEKFLKKANSISPNHVFGLYKDEKHVGNLKLSQYQPMDNIIEIGWLIRKKNWGQGLGTMAGIALCNYAFETLKVRKIELGVVTENEGAVHVYKKIGFKVEGIIRESFYLNGKYLNTVRMGMFKDELVKK